MLSQADVFLLVSATIVFVIELLLSWAMKQYHAPQASREEVMLKDDARRLRLEAEGLLSAATFTESTRLSREAVKKEIEAEKLERARLDRATKTALGRFLNTRAVSSRTLLYGICAGVCASQLGLSTVPLFTLPPGVSVFPFATMLALLPPWADASLETGAVTYLGWVIACSFACGRVADVLIKML